MMCLACTVSDGSCMDRLVVRLELLAMSVALLVVSVALAVTRLAKVSLSCVVALARLLRHPLRHENMFGVV